MSFAEWVMSLPLERIAIYTVAGLLGMLAHAVKKSLRGQLAGSIWSYIAIENRAASFMALGSWIGAVATAIASGALVELGWGMLITSAFTAGWAIDSGVNKGAMPEPRTSLRDATFDDVDKAPPRPGDPNDPGAP